MIEIVLPGERSKMDFWSEDKRKLDSLIREYMRKYDLTREEAIDQIRRDLKELK